MHRRRLNSSSRSHSKNKSRSRSRQRSRSRDKYEKKRNDSRSRSNHKDQRYSNNKNTSTFQQFNRFDNRPPTSFSTMGFPGANQGPKTISFDRRNRSPHDMFRKFGGVITPQDVTGILQIDWKNLNLPKIRKNFYKKNPNPVPYEITKKHFKENEITVRNHQSDMPEPILSFETNIFSDIVVKELKKAGFTKPTAIQSVCWPIALSGMDVIAIAQTGSGKTLGFLMPLFVHIADQPLIKEGEGPIGLILAPTRELALQIEEEVVKFGVKSKVTSICCYGGVDKWKQKTELQRGCDLIISTPGRLIDFLEMGVTNLFRVSYLVLDEADRMLDMGFEPQIRRIISQIRPDRQTLMLSATWPKEVQSLARDFIKDPIHVQIGSLDISLNSNIKQHIEFVEERHKMPELLKILKTQSIPTGAKVLIFCQTKKGCEKLSKVLRYEGFDNLSLHGDKSQKERDYAMDKFRNGRLPIVVATDLAARGLDVKDIAMVINFDFPLNIEDYVHRIGRTGRGGAVGSSFTLFTKDNERLAGDLIKILEECNQHISEKLRQASKFFISNKRKPAFNSRSNFQGGYRNSYSFKNATPNNNSNNNGYSNGYNNNSYSNNNNYRNDNKPYEKISDGIKISAPAVKYDIKEQDHQYNNIKPIDNMLKITPQPVDFNSMLLSQQMYNPQAYNYLANMWTNYQQNPNFTGGLQSLVANDGQPHINNMIPMKLPENGQNFNNNGNGSNSANTIGLKPVVENPSTL